MNCQPSRGDLIYVAGLFDGEGHVDIEKGHQAGGTLKFSIRASINMRGSLCAWLSQAFPESRTSRVGGGVHKYTGRSTGTIPVFMLVGKKCKPFFLDILPYVRHKHRQLEIGLMFIETIGQSGVKTTPATLLLQAQVQQLLLDDRERIKYCETDTFASIPDLELV